MVAVGCSSSDQAAIDKAVNPTFIVPQLATGTHTPSLEISTVSVVSEGGHRSDGSTSSILELGSVSGVTNRLQALRVVDVPDASVPRYDRSDWRHWNDADGDCINARHEVLIEESIKPILMDGDCKTSEGYWLDRYTGEYFTNPSKLDVDHMVPLSNTHNSGGWAWDKDKKETYANFLDYSDHLIAVSASANRSKGASGPDAWKPDQKGYWCNYAVAWIEIKSAWGLSVTTPESVALGEMLVTCTGTVIETEPVVIPSAAPRQKPKQSINLKFDPFGPDRDCGDFATHATAQLFFEAAGGPTSDRHRLDADRDGTACESLP